MRVFGTYIQESLRLSFAAWGVGQRMTTLAGALIALMFAYLALKGIEATLTPSAINGVVVVLGAWFLFLVLVVTPYRMWLAQRRQITNLTEQIRSAITDPRCAALQEQKIRRETAAGYGELVEAAEQLRKRPINSEAEFEELQTDIAEWRKKVTAYIREKNGHSSARLFADNMMFSVIPVPGAFNSNHSSALTALSLFQERLQAHYDWARDRLL